jgi:hypothetical protein
MLKANVHNYYNNCNNYNPYKYNHEIQCLH